MTPLHWRERCQILRRTQFDNRQPFAELYSKYKAWAEEEGVEPLAKAPFGRDLTSRGYADRRRMHDGKQSHGRLGLKLR